MITFRALAFAAALVAVAGTMRLGAQRTQTPAARLAAMLEAYTTGDVGIFDRTITRADWPAITAALRPFFLQSKAPYSAVRAAFLLDLALAFSLQRSDRPERVVQVAPPLEALTVGRELLTTRGQPLGASPDDDRLEVLWHQAALALSQRPLISYPEEYLAAIMPRFIEAERRGVILPNRFALARATAAAERCCPCARMIMPLGCRPSRAPVERTSSADVLTLFDHAAQDPRLDVRAEALVRGAHLLQRIGRPAEALAWLDRAPEHDDRVLGYGGAVVRGLALDVLNRPDESAEAYTRALSFEPAAQVPAIGAAAALLRAGRSDEAVKMAEMARQLPALSNDPWATFQQGDWRFVPAWLAEIRRLAR